MRPLLHMQRRELRWAAAAAAGNARSKDEARLQSKRRDCTRAGKAAVEAERSQAEPLLAEVVVRVTRGGMAVGLAGRRRRLSRSRVDHNARMPPPCAS